MSSPTPRALIAEDEPILAAALAHALQRLWPELDIVATSPNGVDAVQQSLTLRPDILFLDIKMPGKTGLEAAEELAEQWPADTPFPHIVFVTAYDEYALAAFEHAAADYVLKPVNDARLGKTVDRLRQRLRDDANDAGSDAHDQAGTRMACGSGAPGNAGAPGNSGNPDNPGNPGTPVSTGNAHAGNGNARHASEGSSHDGSDSDDSNDDASPPQASASTQASAAQANATLATPDAAQAASQAVNDAAAANSANAATAATAAQAANDVKLAHLLAQLQSLVPPAPRLQMIRAAVGNSVRMIALADVVYFEALDKYINVVCRDSEALIRTSLKELLPQLDPEQFWQIHRGTIVNASAIASAVRDEAGKLSLTLRQHSAQLRVSPLYAHLFRQM